MAQQMSSSACEQQQTIPSDLKIKTGIKRSRTEATIEKEEEGKEEDKKEEKEETNPINKKKRKSAKKGGGTVPNLWQKNGKSGDKQQEEGNNCYFDGTTMRKYLPPLNLEVTVKNGIRYLPPYWGVFRGYSKRRWVGKTIAEVYATEFRNLLHPLYAKAACRKGRVFVNKCPIFDANHCIRDNEFFIHINHRHETEIPNLPIQILAENDDVLVVNKPAGLPVHPCGNYALHTVLGLLRREYGRANELLSCLYRLDRTTTGVLMFAKNQQYDSHFKKLVRDRKLAKEYVCKVEGKFPDGGEIICDAPLGVLCPQLGLRCVRPDGQEALSSFSLLRYLPAENASVVSCTIVTGRTHQIRVHLQFLGHPIIGDRFYNDETWGPDKGKAADYGERTMDQLADDIGKRHSKSHWILERDDEYEQRLRQIGDDETCTVEEFDLKNLEADLEAMPAWDPLCWACAIKKKREMQESDWLMPLHCHRYSGDGWTYEAPLPDWALVDESGNSNSINTDGIIVNGSTTTMETVPMSTTKKRTTDPMAQPPPLTTAAGEEEERGVLNAAMSSSSS